MFFFAVKVKAEAAKSADADSGVTSSELSDSVSESEIIANINRRLGRKAAPQRHWLTPRRVVILLIVGNIPMMLYFSVIHQRGALDVVKFLHLETLDKPDMSVLFLMPCHSTPYYR